MKEIWKDIPSYDGIYQVSNIGNVKGIKRPCSKGGILKPRPMKSGYLTVSLCKDGKAKNALIHRLVALAFYGEIDGKPNVNHIDGNKQNNSVENLEFCTQRENTMHTTYVLKHTKNLKPVICVETGVEYTSLHEAARKNSLSRRYIRNCCNGKKYFKTAGGYHWVFANSINEDRYKG